MILLVIPHRYEKHQYCANGSVTKGTVDGPKAEFGLPHIEVHFAQHDEKAVPDKHSDCAAGDCRHLGVLEIRGSTCPGRKQPGGTNKPKRLSLIHISEPTRLRRKSRMPSSA